MQRLTAPLTLLSVCAALGLSATAARALTIPIDPGLPGETFTQKIIDITADLVGAGVVADGSTLDLDFEFIAMRHLEIDLEPAPPQTAAIEVQIGINWAGGVQGFDSIDDPDATLTDPLSAPRVATFDDETLHFSDFPIFSSTSWLGRWTIDDYPDLVQFHDVHKTLTLATGTSGTPSVVSASLSLSAIPVPGQQFEVGVWVPEPTSMWLAVWGLVGLGVTAGWRRWRKASRPK